MENEKYTIMTIVVDTLGAIAAALAALFFLFAISNVICAFLGI